MASITRRGLLGGLALLPAAGIPRLARATIDPATLDLSRYAYVPSATTPDITVVDCAANRVHATLHGGLVASQAVMSRAAATLVLADAHGGTLALVDVFAGTVRRVAIPARAERLTVSAGGSMIAVGDAQAGRIVLVDLYLGRITNIVDGLPPLRDIMFGRQDTVLYIAAVGLDGIGVVDIATARISDRLAAGALGAAGASALARTADARRVLAQPAQGDAISVVDADGEGPASRLAVGPGIAGIFPTGLGRYVLVPDAGNATLAVFPTGHLDAPVVLPGARGIVGVYATWLDGIAFMPSAAERRVLVYDLDAMHRTDDIRLRGAPVRGAVTPDSQTLYLPVSDPPQLLAVDGQTRSITASIDLPSPPLAALIAGASGLCH